MKGYHTSIIIWDSSHHQKWYYIDSITSLHIQYVDKDDEFLISFKQYHKCVLVATKHYQLVGNTNGFKK